MNVGDWVHCKLLGQQAIGYIKNANGNSIKVKITSPEQYRGSLIMYKRNEVSKGDCNMSPKELLDLIDLALFLKDKYLFDAWTYELSKTKGRVTYG